MSQRFYMNCPLAQGPITITGAEAHHMAAVSRVRPADLIFLFNGDGREYQAVVREVSKRNVIVKVESIATPERELKFKLHVAAPLPKGDRGQFLVEKLTELGATTYTPLVTQRSVIDPGAVRLEKLRRYVIEASKQCGRNVLLTVEPPVSWHEYCGRDDLPVLRWIGNPAGNAPPLPNGQDIAIAVGPEGGFTPEETAFAHAFSWSSISLGPRTLRVETAAIALTALAGGRLA
jgi:16S rRNA (uracil1498-N3)-methyltransferase